MAGKNPLNLGKSKDNRTNTSGAEIERSCLPRSLSGCRLSKVKMALLALKNKLKRGFNFIVVGPRKGKVTSSFILMGIAQLLYQYFDCMHDATIHRHYTSGLIY